MLQKAELSARAVSQLLLRLNFAIIKKKKVEAVVGTKVETSRSMSSFIVLQCVQRA